MINNNEMEVEKDPFGGQQDDEKEIDARWLSMAKKLLKEIPSERDEKVKKFKTEIMEDTNIPEELKKIIRDREPGIYIRFLRAGAWDVEFAHQVVRSYTQLGSKYPNYCLRAIPSKLQHAYSFKLNMMSEKRDKFGRRVYILRMGRWDPDKLTIEDFFASSYLLFELVAREAKTQIAGVTMVSDLSGFGFKHVKCLGIEQVKLMAEVLSGSFPLWFNRLHVVNNPSVFNMVYSISKPFFNERVRDNIIFHGSDLKGLHEEVSPEILPADLGGIGDFDNAASVAGVNELEPEMLEIVETFKKINAK